LMTVRGLLRRSILLPVVVAMVSPAALASTAIADRAQIVGRILGSGLCPAESPSEPCEERPLFAVTVVLRNRHGVEVDRAATNVNGRFSFRASRGSYTARPEHVIGFGPPGRASVVVRSKQRAPFRVRFELAASTGPGVVGQATQSPTCPVQRVGEECVAPLRNARIRVEDSSGSTVRSSVTGENGFYAFSLEPGTYRLVGDPFEGGFPSAPEPVGFTVTGRDTGPRWIPLDYDTGIR
jgi:hypothetical protein